MDNLKNFGKAVPTREELELRIRDLEEKLLAQRVGKRVLLQLLEMNRREQGEMLMKLERENRRLRERVRALNGILRELKRE
ncbi:hypothetical protein [Thermicanus aegyptius]|uniref:hypothetical protein n=1 Tax=Thermicanus aegyptius TaxID=94009 RepID=UPI0004003E7C|nr:hypothetical protein [Thermicanus aegyptius]